MLKINLIFSTLFIFISNSVLANENSGISISDAWVSEAPPTVSVLAAYADIHNRSQNSIELVSISSTAFVNIELHLSKIVNDTATMEKQSSITISTDSTLKLTPGAYHLMLFQPDKIYKEGDSIALDFKFSDGTSISVAATVKKRDNANHNHGHHHHHH